MPISSIMGQIMICGMTRRAKTSPMELRTLADWVVRKRLLTIPGVSQVIVMGGERKQFQVLVDPDLLLRFGVTLHEVKTALEESNQNTAGGYLDEQGPNELLVRSWAVCRRSTRLDGSSSVSATAIDHALAGGRIVERRSGQTGRQRRLRPRRVRATCRRTVGRADDLRSSPTPTRGGSPKGHAALDELQPSLPADVRIMPELYQQKEFIDLAIENVRRRFATAASLVVIILFLFLMNLRTTLITLTAIPLSIVLTAMVFAAFGLSVNTMTLGGLAVAIGELVDDAIVDVRKYLPPLARESPSRQAQELAAGRLSGEL